MLLALALSATVQAAPPTTFSLVPSPCARDVPEHANNTGVLYRHGDRPAEHRQLGDLPDADMILAVYKRDRRGCPILEVVQRNVSTRAEAPPRPTSSGPQGRRERGR